MTDKTATVIATFKITASDDEKMKMILVKEGFKKGQFIADALSSHIAKFPNYEFTLKEG